MTWSESLNVPHLENGVNHSFHVPGGGEGWAELVQVKNLIAQPMAARLRGTQSVPVITFTRHS